MPALTFDMEMFQVLLGEETWSIHFVLEDMDSGEILYAADFPEEEISVDETIWE